MYRELLRDARFFELLLKIDREKTREVRAARCPHCGGPLHAGHFERKPAGLSLCREPLPEEYRVRFDLCCGWCRVRTMPPSMRFLGRKVYLTVFVAVATVVMRGADRDVVRLLRRQVGVSWSTLRRWCRWWQDLVGSAFWTRLRGSLPVDLQTSLLPASLLDRLEGAAAERMLRLLHLLGPISAAVPDHAR